MLKPCSPSGKAQPTMQVLDVGRRSTPVRSTRARTTAAARSSGRIRASAPFAGEMEGRADIAGDHGMTGHAGLLSVASAATSSFLSILPMAVFGKDGTEFVNLRHLDGRKPVLKEGFQDPVVERPAGPDDHEGLHGLAAIGVGHAHDGAVGDVRMAVDRLLDEPRIDLVAAGIDHVLDPVDDIAEALRVEIADVAGLKAPVGEGGRGLVRALPVAGHDLRAAHADLARARSVASSACGGSVDGSRPSCRDSGRPIEPGRAAPRGRLQQTTGEHSDQPIALDQLAIRSAPRSVAAPRRARARRRRCRTRARRDRSRRCAGD